MPPARIDPDSPQHRRLVDLVRSRREFAKRETAARKEAWRSAERLYRSFVDPDEKDAQGKKRHPFGDPIVLPLTYALTQTQLAFDLAAFTQRKPMIPLDGVGPEDVKPARIMEQVLHHESQQQGQLLDLYGWLLDRRRYGVGFLWTSWLQDTGYRTRTETRTEPFTLLGIPFGSRTRTETHRESFVRFEGNQSWVADPFRVWWDPRVPLARLQEGEFCGRTIRRAFGHMREQEAAGFYQNVSRIPRDPKLRQGARDQESGGESDRDRIMGLTESWLQGRSDTLDFLDHGYVDLDEGVFRVIPRDYELSGSDVPEKWWVTLANDAVIVRAEPFDPHHQTYPVAVVEASPDPHARMNPGTVEILQPLARIATWLLNSHVDNIRKVLNDSFLVNPGVIEMKDLLTPQPGRTIRIKREFYNDPQAFDKAVKQLQVTDVTAIYEFAQRVAATPENLQGIISQKDRTLGEQQMAVSSATARLRFELQLAWAQGVVPWTRQRISNIQQYMSEQRFVKVVGNWPRAYRVDPSYPFLRVGPDDVQGQFTYEVIDGTIRATDDVAKLMLEAWKAMIADQVLRQVYDTEELFKEIAQMQGFTNVDDFLRQQTAPPPSYQVRPDEEVDREVERGNLIPGQGPPMGQLAAMREGRGA